MKTKSIKINGEIVLLEERVCEGGCGLNFWCRPGSKQRRARGTANCGMYCDKKVSMDLRVPKILDQNDHFRESSR